MNSKHIELIVRQMFSRIRVTNAGDSTFFPGDVVDIIRFRKENRELAKAGQNEAIGVELLLGLTKISLFTGSLAFCSIVPRNGSRACGCVYGSSGGLS